MNTITFFVEGIPKGQPRPRAFARNMGGGMFVARVYDAGSAESWKSCIAVAARAHLPAKPLSGPVRLIVAFYMPRPKSHYRKRKGKEQLRPDAPLDHTVKPDIDNLIKAVMDCLTKLGMWGDDSQVCEKTTVKRYAPPELTGASIWLEAIDSEITPQPTGATA